MIKEIIIGTGTAGIIYLMLKYVSPYHLFLNGREIKRRVEYLEETGVMLNERT